MRPCYRNKREQPVAMSTLPPFVPSYWLLRPREPFDLARTLRFILSPPGLLKGQRFPPLLDYFEEGEYRRVADVGGQLVLYGVREEIEGKKPALRVRILAGRPDDTIRR